jgi:hypothetical protein
VYHYHRFVSGFLSRFRLSSTPSDEQTQQDQTDDRSASHENTPHDADALLESDPIGSGAANVVPFAASLSAGWKLLAVWKYACWDRVKESLRSQAGEMLLAALQYAARMPTGKFQDDFTVVLLEDSIA